MNMGHQALLLGEGAEQILICLDRIDRGEAQARKLGKTFQDVPHEAAEVRRAGQVGAIGRNVDPGQYRFAVALLEQAAQLFDNGRCRDRAGGTARKGYDAEGAAVVAAVLNGNKGPRMSGKIRDGRVRGVFQLDGRGYADPWRCLASEIGIARGFQLLAIAEDAIDLVHGSKGAIFELGGATRDNEASLRALATRAADGLTGLSQGFGRHGTGVEDDGVVQTGVERRGADHLGLIGVEPAAEGNDLDIVHAGTVRSRSGSSPSNS